MTRDEAKKVIPVAQIAARYGLEVKRGFCICPFHEDRRPSMKIYPESYHCFSCGAHGDIFSLVMHFEGCSFPEALERVGCDDRGQQNSYEAARTTDEQRRKKRDRDFRSLIVKTLSVARAIVKRSEPFSEEWSRGQNTIQSLEQFMETGFVKGEEVNREDAIRICKRFLTSCK